MNEVYADVIAIPFHSKTSLLLIWCPSDIPHALPRCHQTTLCRVSETLHQIHGRDVLTWIFYSLSACHLLSWRTHNDPHLQPTVCHRASACGASPCTVSHVFLRGLKKRAHYFNTAVFCCCCKLPAVKTKKKSTPPKTAIVSPASGINRFAWSSSVALPTPVESRVFWCLCVCA